LERVWQWYFGQRGKTSAGMGLGRKRISIHRKIALGNRRKTLVTPETEGGRGRKRKLTDVRITDQGGFNARLS